MTRSGSSGRRALLFAAVVAAGLVVSRSLGPLACEQLFDSDQAIVGLMAKHLSELRSFPLFFYGQHYMLGVQAWLAAPFFWLGGPTVAMLRLPMVIVNVTVAVALIAAFSRAGVRPVLALVAALPLVATTPVVSVELLAAIGASIEPFASLLLLWALARRPIAFGAVLCVAVLHREFTVFALPALAAAEWRQWRSWSPARLAKGAGAFAAVWLAIDVLKQQVGVVGPPGAGAAAGSLTLGTRTILSWLSFEPHAYFARLRELLTWGMTDMLGVRAHPLGAYGLPSALTAGSALAAVALGGAALAMILRMAWLARRPAARERAGGRGLRFCAYLALVALQTVLAYGLNGGIAAGLPPVLRYALFALLLPVALFGAYFQIEPSRRWQTAVALAIGAWGVLNLADNARFMRELETTPPPRYRRVMADYLVAHGIEYGRAQYWDAYVIVFLSRERAILASTDKVRIPAYQADVEAHASTAVTLLRQPCDDGVTVARWCVVGPVPR